MSALLACRVLYYLQRAPQSEWTTLGVSAAISSSARRTSDSVHTVTGTGSSMVWFPNRNVNEMTTAVQLPLRAL